MVDVLPKPRWVFQTLLEKPFHDLVEQVDLFSKKKSYFGSDQHLHTSNASERISFGNHVVPYSLHILLDINQATPRPARMMRNMPPYEPHAKSMTCSRYENHDVNPKDLIPTVILTNLRTTKVATNSSARATDKQRRKMRHNFQFSCRSSNCDGLNPFVIIVPIFNFCVFVQRLNGNESTIWLECQIEKRPLVSKGPLTFKLN